MALRRRWLDRRKSDDITKLISGCFIRPGELACHRLLTLSILFTLLSGCTSAQELTCRQGEKTAVMESLYFGRNKPTGTVSIEEWTRFVNQVITPAFPEGLTSWAAAGQWQLANGAIDREDSYVLQLAHDQTPEKESAVQHIVARYKHDFKQETVMRVRSRSCISY